MNLFKNCKNSKNQGDIGLAYSIAYLSRIGVVSLPLTDNQAYDVLVDIDGKIYKVQVKTSQSKKKNGCYEVALKTCGGNKSRNFVNLFDKNKVDYLFILLDDNSQYFIPTSEIDNKSTITLGNLYKNFQIN